MSWLSGCLVWLALLATCWGFGERYALLRKAHPLPECLPDEDDRDCPQDSIEQDDYVDPYAGCYSMGSIVKKIDYGPTRDSDLHVLPSSSACLRCGLCLAVADQLNDTLTKAQDNNTVHVETSFLWDFGPDDSEEVDLEPEVVTRVLRDSCENSFLNYGLREYKGERYVTEALSFTDHVPTSLDGTWTENLQSLCRVFLSEYGELNLYKDWLRYEPRDLTPHLCSSHGIFRDCMNVDINNHTATSELFRNLRKPCCL